MRPHGRVHGERQGGRRRRRQPLNRGTPSARDRFQKVWRLAGKGRGVMGHRGSGIVVIIIVGGGGGVLVAVSPDAVEDGGGGQGIHGRDVGLEGVRVGGGAITVAGGALGVGEGREAVGGAREVLGGEGHGRGVEDGRGPAYMQMAWMGSIDLL